ncbi:MAG: class I SAM-dependent methyltransferase [Calditrichia bacterium]|nr:class I SAM-dependent methyltransferase [Calditrichia bacterium]
MSKSNDKALRIYHEVFELDRLHYGMWLPEEELSIDNLKIAQERYETYLKDNISEGVKTILDVGCGTGIMTKTLLDSGYDVEGLSPDINQKKIFTENLNVKFHHCAFREFSPNRQYDCLIMSESAQYLKIDKLFKVAKEALNENCYLMVCDYFVLNNAVGIFKKSGHNYEQFLNQAKDEGFTLVNEKDITNDVTKTLDMGKMCVEKLMLALEIVTEKIRRRHPHVTRFLKWKFRKKIEKYDKQIQLLDSQQFKNYKTYRYILFQLNGNR